MSESEEAGHISQLRSLRGEDTNTYHRWQAARALGERAELSVAAIEALLDTLDDERWTYDPFDPPGFDGTSGLCVSGNATQHGVAEAAASALVTAGGERVIAVLAARLAGAETREQAARHAHRLRRADRLARDPDPAIRIALVPGFATTGEPALWHALVDPHPAVTRALVTAIRVAVANELIRPKTRPGLEPARPAGQLATVERMLATADPSTHAVRFDALVLACLLDRAWSELARIASALSPADLARTLELLALRGDTAIAALCAADPALRPAIRAACAARGETARARSATWQLDYDVFTAIVRAAGRGSKRADDDPAWLPVIAAILFSCPEPRPLGLDDLCELVLRSPDAFAHVLGVAGLHQLLGVMRDRVRPDWKRAIELVLAR